SNTASRVLNHFFPRPIECSNLAERYSFQCLSSDHHACSKVVSQCMIVYHRISLFFSTVLAVKSLQTIFKKLGFLYKRFRRCTPIACYSKKCLSTAGHSISHGDTL